MISINNLSIQFNGEMLFDNVSFIINDRDRIGLVGKNGAGKSTLLRIIKGIQIPEKGMTVASPDTLIGYLPQEMIPDSKRTVWDEAVMAFHHLRELEARIHSLEKEIAERTDFESKQYAGILHRHHEAYDRYTMLGGNAVQGETERVLTGLGFLKEEFSRPMNQFSSGWQMRVEIAKILLQQPDVILLDEPTNHLDIESIQWLEEYLKNYKGAVVVVSHDRAFLDNVTNRTIEITLGKIYDYKTNYSEYVVLREERLEQQMATFNNQQRQIDQIERFVERFRYQATKAKQVQSRIKLLEKIQQVEIDEIDTSSIYFRFLPSPHSGKIVMEATGIKKNYGTKEVLHSLDFIITKEDRIAFVGKNGEGKTTLSKIMAGEVGFNGNLKFGQNIQMGYYAQNQTELLDPDKTVYDVIDAVAVGDIRPKIRNILGSFLFSGDSIDKKVKVLSGGEKSRLAIARLLLSPVNLLILDEPTNHLDMRSKDILKNALIHYDGTLIIVSHDRDFLHGLTNRVFEFSRKRIREYFGDVYDYLESRKLQSLKDLETSEKKPVETNSRENCSTQKISYEKRKEQEKEIRKLKNRIQKCEEEIGSLESGIRQKDEMLMDPEQYKLSVMNKELYREYESLKLKLEEEMKRWEELQLLLEKLTSGESG